MPVLFLLFGFFLYVYLEISLLVSVGSAIGVLPLILLMIAISVAGLWVVKARGLYTMWQIKSQISEGKIPTQAVVSSVFFAIAGVLLIIPGFLSDILAILLVLPVTRNLLHAVAMKFFANKIKFFSFGQRPFSPQNDTTFDAEFERKTDEDKWIK